MHVHRHVRVRVRLCVRMRLCVCVFVLVLVYVFVTVCCVWCVALWCGVGVLWCVVRVGVVCVGVCVSARSTLSAVSLNISEIEQLYQEKRMVGGLGNMLFSTCSQTENV